MAAGRRWTGVLAVLMFLAVVGLGTAGALSRNRVSGTIGERDVLGLTRHAFSSASLSASESGLTLTLGGASASVTHQAVELPGDRVHAIPEGCRHIEVRETPAGLRVAFDGVLAE